LRPNHKTKGGYPKIAEIAACRTFPLLSPPFFFLFELLPPFSGGGMRRVLSKRVDAGVGVTLGPGGTLSRSFPFSLSKILSLVESYGA